MLPEKVLDTGKYKTRATAKRGQRLTFTFSESKQRNV
jgi:hypothetical protein